MTEHHEDAPDDMFDESVDLDASIINEPLAPWIHALANEVTFPSSEMVPRDMMWARIQRQRREAAVPVVATSPVPHRLPHRRVWLMRAAGIAAVMVGGIGVGRYLMPLSEHAGADLAATQLAERADSIAALGLGPDALAALPYSNDPARIAMEEHLGRTMALLTTVRDDNPAFGPGADIRTWARDLLGTTRMLIDEPQLSDERTRRLLQDLELVLAQIIQARTSVPETQRAPSETMRETNLLLRVRAATTASRFGDDLTFGGDP